MIMKNDLNTFKTKLRMKALMSYDRDGLADLLFGWILINIGLYLQYKWIMIYFVSILPIMFVFPFLKRKITIPRIGYVKFRTRRTRLIWAVGIAGGLFLLTAVITGFLLKTTSGFIGPFQLAVVGIALIMIAVAGFNRIVGYAILVPLFIASGLGFRLLTPAMVIVVGVAVLLLGIWLLVSFIRMYPIMDDEEPDVEI
jgi:hypothetical protein